MLSSFPTSVSVVFKSYGMKLVVGCGRRLMLGAGLLKECNKPARRVASSIMQDHKMSYVVACDV